MAHKTKLDPNVKRASAVTLAKHLLNAPRDSVLGGHLRKVLNTTIWMHTIADGKKRPRYFSIGSTAANAGKLEHEHVYQRERMITAMLNNPSEADKIMASAVACTVTKSEHDRLHQCDALIDGWPRYILAGIDVIDRQTGKSADLHELATKASGSWQPAW
jgi:hypothetical protein